MDIVFSADKVYDPFFYNWNRFHINYCDGSGHWGHREAPIITHGEEIYFRGQKNTEA